MEILQLHQYANVIQDLFKVAMFVILSVVMVLWLDLRHVTIKDKEDVIQHVQE